MSKRTDKAPIKAKLRNWRDIQQKNAPRATTGYARNRRILSICRWMGIITAVLVVSGAAGYGLYAAAQGTGGAEVQRVLARITFRTDGVLNDQWLRSVCDLQPGMPLDSLDIHALKQHLETFGQVRQATVMRKLPNELVVEVRERTPVLRARVGLADGSTKLVLVARDGTVYDGYNYPTDTLRSLPYLAGVSFKRGENGILPLEGMDIVADLLDKTRAAQPHLYSGLKVVSCEHFDGTGRSQGSLIKVHSRHVGELIFAPTEFDQQIARLTQVIRHTLQGNRKEIARVDLSLPGQAIVQYQGPTTTTKR